MRGSVFAVPISKRFALIAAGVILVGHRAIMAHVM
jgi:hypothetical protein